MSNKVFKVRYKLIIENLQLKSGTMYLTDSNATKGIFQMRHCAIWCYLHNSKNAIYTHGGVLLKVPLLHGCFSRFLNCANYTKWRKASQINKLLIEKY